MIDIRKIFDRHHIHWRDRGKNVSHNNLVISCPYCNKTLNKDPGEHLSINYLTGEFFCYRNSHHKGFVSKVFYDLGIPRNEYKDLQIKQVQQEFVQETKDFSLWQYFQPAEDSQEAIQYLVDRKFDKPVETCHKFKLKVDIGGHWAGRLLIPLTSGWTGRAMRPHIEPRYLAETTRDGFFLFRQGSTTCMLLEGAIDAMRVATVSRQFDVIAKCRNGLSPAILSYLKEQRYLTILNVPDTDVDFTLYFEELRLLQSYCIYSNIGRLSLPQGFKDFGEMDEFSTREFLIKKAHV